MTPQVWRDFLIVGVILVSFIAIIVMAVSAVMSDRRHQHWLEWNERFETRKWNDEALNRPTKRLGPKKPLLPTAGIPVAPTKPGIPNELGNA